MMSSKFIVSCAVLYMFIAKSGGNLQPDLKIIRSGYFREYENVIPYETTAKIIFKLRLPSNSISPPIGVCHPTNVSCRVEQTLFHIYHQNVRMLQTIVEANRKERQLGVLAVGVTGGILLHSVFSRISNSLFGTENDAVEAVSKLRAAMEHNNKEVLLFEHDVRSFAINLTVQTVSLIRNQQDILTVLNLLEVNAQIRNNWVNVELGLQSCFNRHVPFTLITPKLLRNSLANVSSRAYPHGFLLSISSKNVEKYYKINIADCFLTDESLYVMVNIPLSRRKWKIAQLVPVPFSSHNLTCHFGSKTPITIAADGDVISMDAYASQFCDVSENQLCMVPTLSSSSRLEICLKTMYYGKDGTNSSKYCRLECENNSHLTTYEVSPSVIVATNGRSLKTTCGTLTREYRLEGAGAVEIKLRCNCSYLLDGKALNAGLTCAQGSHEFHDVITVIPEIWAKISVRNAFIHPTEKEALLNMNWSLLVPQVRDNLIVPESFNNFRLDLNGTVLLVVGALVSLLMCGVFALACCYCKLMKV